MRTELILVAVSALLTVAAWLVVIAARRFDAMPALQVGAALAAVGAAAVASIYCAGQAPWLAAALVVLGAALLLIISAAWRVFGRGRPRSALESATVRARDGTRVVFHARSQTGLSAVVIVHGLGGASHRRSLLRLADALADLADPVLMDLRGHGCSDGAADGREWMDLEACVTELRSRGYDTVHLVGFSNGSVAALGLAARDPEIASVTAVSPLGRRATLERVIRHYGTPLGRLLTRGQGGLLAHPRDGHMGEVAVGEEAAPHIVAPILTVAAERDWLLPSDDARALCAAARAPTDLVILPGRRHGPLLFERYEAVITSAIREHIDGAQRSAPPGDVTRA